MESKSVNSNRILPPCRHTLCLALICTTTMASSKDFGIIGPTFPIGEIDMLQWIEQRLKHFERTGKLADLQNEFQSRVKRKVQNPAPLPLSTTTTPETFYVNPSLTFPAPVLHPQTGEIIAAKGQTINPFDSATWPTKHAEGFPNVELSKVLLFLDARDAKQRAFAKQFTHKKPIKYVLTGGHIEQTAQLLGARIYHAQDGFITHKLHIKHVPSLAYQEGVRWRIDEFDVSSLSEEDAEPTP
ncbi:type-F conjugative transfer system protein TraW [Vibrio europaeus]|uniref:type-F conjugative transfer system protein TraW n=1 Tax=Vibrio oreintalis group TaxID=1891919 RepID=UPI00233EC876|nr:MULTISPECIES: type-F conjugative transfer system protein TraW [Vibrio oreintalis group]MDC5808805.1 type-F conjugative transfer system protein TraW [Vibrio europaeus]